jgi:hypothetical protein
MVHSVDCNNALMDAEESAVGVEFLLGLNRAHRAPSHF